MDQAQALLSRLEKVKETGPGKWIACCPAHNDRSPSLSIKEVDGRILLKCWAGCGAADVLHALGLDWSALFPERLPNSSPLPRGQRWFPRDAVEALAHEIWIVMVAACATRAGHSLTAGELRRVHLAANRLWAAFQEVSR